MAADAEQPIPLQKREEPARRSPFNDFSFASPEIRAAIADFFRSHTFNGQPMDIEGNNIRVSLESMQHRMTYNLQPTKAPVAAQLNAPHIIRGNTDLTRPTVLTPPSMVPIAPPPAGRGAEPPSIDRAPARLIRGAPAIYGRSATDHTVYGNARIPILFKRADGQKKIVAYVDAPMSLDATSGVPTSLGGASHYYKAAGNDARFAFGCSDASDDSGAKILILDGLVGTFEDQDFPSGMGADNYIIGVSDGQEVWVGFTYNTTSFAVTSRYLNVGGSTPDSTFGTANIQIADVHVESGSSGATVTPTNARCGDLVAEFEFGSLNGKPAIKFGDFTEWVEIPQT